MNSTDIFEKLKCMQIPIYVLPNSVSKFRKKKELKLIDVEETESGTTLWFQHIKDKNSCFTMSDIIFIKLWKDQQIEVKNIFPNID